MCGGVQFTIDEKEWTIYFPNPKAKLPVIKKDGSIILLPWGRRKEEAGELSLGGWARQESIEKGIWHKYLPIAVKISAKRFMEKDFDGVSHWFDMTQGQYIQGLVAREQDELRVYIVTIVPERPTAIYERWPKIVAKC